MIRCFNDSIVSEIEMDAYSNPFHLLSIELSVRRRTGKVFGQNLNLPVADAGIFKLKTGHERARDGPIGPFIGLEVRIGNGADLSTEKGAGTGVNSTPHWLVPRPISGKRCTRYPPPP